MANKRLIFCVECDESSKTDQRYVEYILGKYYHKNIPKVFVYLKGKSNYDSKNAENNITKEIKNYKKTDPLAEIDIIYFIDLDNKAFQMSNKNIAQMTLITQYCSSKGYKLVIFVKGIEDVLKVAINGSKVNSSIDFINNTNKPDIQISMLEKTNPSNVGESNILIILDQYYTRK